MSDDVVVRMYNVGFGDCFLIKIPTDSGESRMLVDCGTIATAGFAMGDIVARIIEDVTDSDGVPRIDVVVATHRHRDHVSGFSNNSWSQVEVGEVWMPWTEHPNDRRALDIRNCQSRLALHLEAAFRPATPNFDIERHVEYQMALNAMTNEAAMTTLHEGFAASRYDDRWREPLRRFLPELDSAQRVFRTPVMPGVRFHILGPSFDGDDIRNMTPPVGQSYLNLVDDRDLGKSVPPLPFSKEWWVRETRLEQRQRMREREKQMIVASTGDLGEAALLALEQSVNGTSLFFIMQVGDANLVFPGDAQWGTWRMALESPSSRQLMQDTAFYKVGHHGSHNANPVEFVKLLNRRPRIAMTSVRSVSKWPDIPRRPLMTALADRATLVRSDKRPGRSTSLRRDPRGMFVEASVPTGRRRTKRRKVKRR